MNAQERRRSVGRLVVLACIAPLAGVGGQSTDIVPLTRLSGPVALDGISHEEAWAHVPPLPMTMYAPTFRGELTERTDVRVAYDDAFLYIAARLYDSEPHGIRANTFYRDRYSGDDVLAVILDTFNDYENALWFAINPLGARTDRSVTNDAEVASREGFSRTMNQSWNTYWDAETVRNGEGWFAELRIPFSSLRFQDDGGRVVMGLSIYRYIARKNERHTFPAIPPKWSVGFAKPSQGQRVSLQGVSSHNPVYLTPYAIGGFTRTVQLNASETAFDSDTDRTGEAGLDLKYSPSSNLTLDLTVNTDFAQVEADDQQVNLTRFSLFFPEKRQFFQERSGLFEFGTGGLSRLFHSRQAGLSEEGPVRILGGARLVGRVGRTDIGVLNLQTAASSGLAAENFGIARLRRQIFNPYSNVGAMLTTRFGNDGGSNVALGTDATIRPFGDEYVTVKWAITSDNETTQGASALDVSRIVARWERRSQVGFRYELDFIRSGVDYNPGVGFVTRSDFTFLANQFEYQWWPGTRSPFRQIGLGIQSQTYLRNAGGVESSLIQPSFQFEFKGGDRLTLAAENSYEGVQNAFALSGGTPIVPGDYWFHEARLDYSAPEGALFRPSLTASAGTFYDGWRVSVGTGPVWYPSRHLEIGGNYTLNVIRFPDRGEALNAHLLRARVQAALNIHLSLSAFVQYNSALARASVNARIRYHFQEGSDLWLVYDEGLNSDRTLQDGLRMPLSDARALLVKYTYTFIR